MITLIPIVDTIGDVRDIAGNRYHIVNYYGWEEERDSEKEFWLWADLVISFIGCIPEAGSVVKGVLKLLKQALPSARKVDLGAVWEQAIDIANYFGRGNAARWLDDKWRELGRFGTRAIDELALALRTLQNALNELASWAKGLAVKALDQARKGVDEALKFLDNGSVKRVVEWFKEKWKEMLKGKHKVEQRGKSNRPGEEQTNVRKQEAEPPPDGEGVDAPTTGAVAHVPKTPAQSLADQVHQQGLGSLRTAGNVGSTSNIREFPGTESAARQFFDSITQGGTIKQNTPKLKVVEMPDGSFLTFRPAGQVPNKTTGIAPPSIDINIPGQDHLKLKMLP